eukprot:GHVO01050658.1.p1 GENE.GHVO01050658.1~~GHVO01050658.1.p1  ORF type:complete len:123 (+),score=9.97 GHVO01050658.1:206-574(+)
MDDAMVKTYLTKRGIQPEAVERLERNGVIIRNYRVEVKASEVSALMKPDMWPKDVMIRPFFSTKTRTRTLSDLSKREEDANSHASASDPSIKHGQRSATDSENTNTLLKMLGMPLSSGGTHP